MAAYQLKYSQVAVDDIKRLPPHIQSRLKAKLEWLAAQGSAAADKAEALPKATDARYRLRSGVYRILFDIDAGSIVVLHVQHRRDVYATTYH